MNYTSKKTNPEQFNYSSKVILYNNSASVSSMAKSSHFVPFEVSMGGLREGKLERDDTNIVVKHSATQQVSAPVSHPHRLER